MRNQFDKLYILYGILTEDIGRVHPNPMSKKSHEAVVLLMTLIEYHVVWENNIIETLKGYKSPKY